MQGLLAIPSFEKLQTTVMQQVVLMQKVAGVALLVRVLATAKRAAVDSVLVIWPEGVDRGVSVSCAESSLLKGLQVNNLVLRDGFDPASADHWAAIAPSL